MSQKIASLYAEISADTTKYKRGLQDVRKDLQSTDQQAKKTEETQTRSFSNIAMAIGGAAAGLVALKKGYDFAREGAEIATVETRFYRLAGAIGTTGDALKKDLLDVTGGLISDFDAMAMATDLMSLGLAKSHDEAIRMSNVASQLGMDMNEMVLTLTNQTVRRFDQLGVSTDGFKDRLQELKDQGMDTNEAFTEAFLQQAEEQLERIGSVADTSEGAFMRLEASVGNLANSLKQKLAPPLAVAADGIALLLNWNGDLKDMFDETANRIKENSGNYEEYTNKMLEAAVAAKQLTEGEAKLIREQGLGYAIAKTYGDEIGLLTETEWNRIQALKVAIDYEERRDEGMYNNIDTTEENIKTQEELNEELQEQIDKYKELIGISEKEYKFGGIGADVEFVAEGGLKFEDVQANLEEAYALSVPVLIDPDTEQITKDFIEETLIQGAQEAQIAWAEYQVEVGNMTEWEAAGQAADQLGITTTEAYQLMQEDNRDWNKILTGSNDLINTVIAAIAQLDGMESYANIYITKYVTTVKSGGWQPKPGYTPENQDDQLGTFGEFMAEGGPLADVSIVGERGQELIINGVVIPHDTTQKLLGLGLKPDQGFLMGGSLPGDYLHPVSGNTITPTTPSYLSDTEKSSSSIGQLMSAQQEIQSDITSIITSQDMMQSQQTSFMSRATQETATRIERSNNKVVARLDTLIAVLSATAPDIARYISGSNIQDAYTVA